ncbi:hypothetical protein PN500_15985 [Dolichospermum circinale CS-541/06]|nr:hypothetical protein [Dolichospermum circinale]MDB9455786.1 hypothetical protein [Dolichospermum circinale CS-541/06]
MNKCVRSAFCGIGYQIQVSVNCRGMPERGGQDVRRATVYEKRFWETVS